MKILLVNWQDRLNPSAGGAEIHLHEIFGRLALRGHEVTLLASGWPGARPQEQVDGISVHRVGGRFTFGAVAPRAGRRLVARERPDVLVEALNKVPVFSPAWSARPTVLLVHHLFGTSAFQEAGVPVAAATWLLERPLPQVYRRVPVQAISHSTADDLAARGLPRANVRVIHPGVDLSYYTPAPDPRRTAAPTFLYLGRLKRYKRVDLILRALALLRERGTTAFLVIAGRGEWEPKLRQLVARLDLEDRVEFTGFVDEGRKRELMRAAWANVFVSPKEGWGITNLEAGACGTPTIASDSPGLRESVVHQQTGELVPHGDVEALARTLQKMADDRTYVDRLGRAAHAFAQQFTWERAAEETEAHLDSVIRGNGRSRIPPESIPRMEVH